MKIRRTYNSPNNSEKENNAGGFMPPDVTPQKSRQCSTSNRTKKRFQKKNPNLNGQLIFEKHYGNSMGKGSHYSKSQCDN